MAQFWDFPELLARFQEQSKKRRLLVWGTGMEGEWGVQVTVNAATDTESVTRGHRHLAGSIAASDGWLLLTGWDSLIAAAGATDTVLPLPNERERKQLIKVTPGLYNCYIVQMHDHTYDEEKGDTEIVEAQVHYVITLRPTNTPVPAWNGIPWSDL